MLVPEVVVNKDGDWVTPVMKDEEVSSILLSLGL